MRRLTGFATIAALALAGAACGGGSERQDADEPEGTYDLEIVDARFPAEQKIAKSTTMRLQVRNADTKAAPNIAATLRLEPEKNGGAAGSFAQSRDDAGLADPSRPVWIVDRGPVGGENAYTNTWSLGRLGPGELRTFEWRVTPVKAGDYQIDYTISPGLDGKATPVTKSDVNGTFRVTVDGEPSDARIAADGRTVVREDSDE